MCLLFIIYSFLVILNLKTKAVSVVGININRCPNMQFSIIIVLSVFTKNGIQSKSFRLMLFNNMYLISLASIMEKTLRVFFETNYI